MVSVEVDEVLGDTMPYDGKVQEGWLQGGGWQCGREGGGGRADSLMTTTNKQMLRT